MRAILIAARPLIAHPEAFFCLLFDISVCLYILNDISKWPTTFANPILATVIFLEVITLLTLAACFAFGVAF